VILIWVPFNEEIFLIVLIEKIKSLIPYIICGNGFSRGALKKLA
jgi:hypothetical protein